MTSVRLELTWTNKDKFLLTPKDETGKPVWVERGHPAAHEIRTTTFGQAFGETSDDNPYSDNLLFQGDALDVLRTLTKSPEFRDEYRGKVKLVYIDPPYNTGSVFEHYDDWLEHSTWLSFMRERLVLIRDLLANDGSVWIHLDDAEQHRMRVLMDEVFGEQNFVATVIWEKNDSPRMDTKLFSSRHDIVHIYRKTDAFKLNQLPREKSHANKVDEQGRPYYLKPLRASGGQGSTRAARPNLFYALIAPDGSEVLPKLPSGEDGCWRWGREKYEREGDRVEWIQGRNGWSANYRIYETEDATVPPQTLWGYQDVGSTRNSAAEIKAVLNGKAFSTPKPERFLERVITLGSNPGDIVVDVFGGSGTTGAVAHKMNRRWVMSEIMPATIETFTSPRLQKVIQGTDTGGVSESQEWQGGGGFREVVIDEPCYVETDFGTMVAEAATGERLKRSVAAQLGFTYNNQDDPFCGVKGRMKLVIIEGAAGVEEVADVISRLEENERATIAALSFLPDCEEQVAKLSKGSRCLKIPRDILGNAPRERHRKSKADQS